MTTPAEKPKEHAEPATGGTRWWGLQMGIAFLWGVAEATFFFIVPDVFISMLATQRRARAALLAALAALAGALLGGWIMFTWGALTPREAIFGFLNMVPAVSRDMIAAALQDMQEMGARAVLFGPLSGTPYKIYAALAPHAGLALPAFLLISVPARLVRFLLSALVAHALAGLLRRYAPGLNPLWVWGGFWLAFYGLWFALMDG